MEMPQWFPPYFPSAKRYLKQAHAQAGSDHLAAVYTRILARHGVAVKEINFRLVRRVWFPKSPIPLPLWRWEPARPSKDGVFVTYICDEDWELQHAVNPSTMARPKPLSEPDNVGGYRLDFGKEIRLLPNDSLWLRVIIDVRSNWEGQIEFQGPSPDKRCAYKRRKITLQSTGDMEAG